MAEASSPDEQQIVVCALYHFARLPDFAEIKPPLDELLQRTGLRGTLLLASEGINGTVAGTRPGVNELLAWLKSDSRFANIACKESLADEMPFYRAKVKLKKEIVTMGIEDIDPNNIVGTYVSPANWNELISDPDVTVIDTRNEYEIQIGTFRGAINPHTTTFREFPEYAAKNLNPSTHKKVAMFCTGGIRCEKSTAFLKAQGFDEVYHLEGGILKYLEEVPKETSLWEGECFVFDDRVAVNHDLEPGQYDQCHACRMPITDTDKLSNAYIQGVSCPHCIDKYSDDQRERFKEREKQVQLAKQRGESHIGADAVTDQQKHKAAKKMLKEKQRGKNNQN